jgi:CRP-like cAMP-binding protein
MTISEESLLNLHHHPLLRGLSESEIHFLQQVLEERVFDQGAIVLKANQLSSELYLLMKGGFSYTQQNAYDPDQLTTYLLQAPNIFNESSLLTPAPKPYEIKAFEDGTLVYVFDRKHLMTAPDPSALSNKLLLNLVRMELEGLRPSPVVIGEIFQREQILKKWENSLKSIKEEFLLRWAPKELNSQERQEIEEIVEVKHLEKEDSCIQQNDPVHSFYFLVDGQLNVLEWNEAKKQFVLSDLLKPGDSFGEISLMTPMLSPYTIQASHPSTLLILDRKKLEQFSAKSAIQKLLLHLAQYHPDPSSFIKKNYGEITFLAQREQKPISQDEFDRLDFLRHHWLTEGLNEEEIGQLDHFLHYQEYQRGEKIIQNQVPNRDLYFLLEGEAILEHQAGILKEKMVEKLQPYDVFGEGGFVTGQDSTMTVEPIKDSKILQFSFDNLKEHSDPKEKMTVKLFTACARLMEQRLDRLKSKEEEGTQLKIRHLIKQKYFWILCLIALMLSYLSHFKERSPEWNLLMTLFQVFIPVGFIYVFLKDSLKNWGWDRQFLVRSLLQAVISIGLIGGIFAIIAQIIDSSPFQFFSSWPMRMDSSLSVSAMLNYLFFVVVEEWLRRGIVVQSLKRGLEDKNGYWTALFSAFLFLGYSATYSPLLCLAFFIKDLGLALLFLRAPHLIGVILIHFVLGLFLASLGWFLL